MKKKKSLGQHFLHNEQICQRIADLVEPPLPQLDVLEVGPGAGALTRFLVQRKDLNLTCCELDERFARDLARKFPQLKDRIIPGDFLQLDPRPFFPDQFNVVGNFPYNISSQIVFRVLDLRERIPQMMGMFQKELAQRVCCGPGSKVYGIISVLAQAYYHAEYLFEIGPENFDPPPQVDSAVIRLSRRDRSDLIYPKRFKSLVKQAFSQRRKTLRNTLKHALPEDRLKDEFFSKRAEALSVEEFEGLAIESAEFLKSKK